MIAFDELGTRMVSFRADEGLEAGAVCKMTGNGTVGPCDEEDAFIGVVDHVRGDVAGVIIAGYVELPYSGTSAPALGLSVLAADDDGGVAAADEGRTCLVVSVNTTDAVVGLML